MFSLFNSGKFLTRQGSAIAILDLLLANAAVVFGFYTFHFYHFHSQHGWIDLMLQILQLPIAFIFPTRSSPSFLLIFTFCTFFVEACLSILLIHGIRKLDGDRLRLWFRIRLFLFVLTFVSLVIRTVDLRYVDEAKIILEQGAVGIILMVYRGYGLIVVTFLEELAYKRLMGTTYSLV